MAKDAGRRSSKAALLAVPPFRTPHINHSSLSKNQPALPTLCHTMAATASRCRWLLALVLLAAVCAQ